MPDVRPGPLNERLRASIGGDLRGVLVYDGPDYDTELRTDVDNMYDEVDFMGMAEVFFRTGIDSDRKNPAARFDTGEFEGFVWVFDDAYFDQYVIDRFTGVVVSLDRVPEPPLGRVQAIVEDYLESETST